MLAGYATIGAEALYSAVSIADFSIEAPAGHMIDGNGAGFVRADLHNAQVGLVKVEAELQVYRMDQHVALIMKSDQHDVGLQRAVKQ